tara:strand:- start:1030 stop:1611 length:582 start_codon:yes stop_codon:yes gene_type:complete
MIIFAKYKKGFMRVPKTGTWTISEYFEKHLVVKKERHNYVIYKKPEYILELKNKQTHTTHATLDTIKEQYTKYPLPSYFFTIVRHPFTRTISEYNDYCKRFGQVDLDIFIEQELHIPSHINYWTEGQHQYYKDCAAFYKFEDGIDIAFEKEGIPFKLSKHFHKSLVKSDLNDQQKERIYYKFKREFEDLNYDF